MTWYYVCGAMLLGRMANCIDQQMLWTYIYVMNIYIYIYRGWKVYLWNIWYLGSLKGIVNEGMYWLNSQYENCKIINGWRY